MRNYSIKLGAVFGFITVITTLGVHLIPLTISASTFEEAVTLYQNTTYLFSRWWIIFHCVAVFIAMSGVYVALNNNSNIHAKLGLISFSVFCWAEITRMLLSLTYLANLRRSYVEQADPLLKSILRADIENFRFVGEGLFAVFALGFALGNLFYGIEISKMKGLSRIVGALLLFWFLTSILGLVNLFSPSDKVTGFFEIYNVTFQPITRGLTAWWLWKQASVEKVVI
jgi:hypothetical protein